MYYNELKEMWISEEKKGFKGWDFSHINDRSEEEGLPWNYRDIVLENLKNSDILLDMGTGGGEFLLTLKHPYENTSATEGYPPNLELCKKVLAPLGIDVRQVVDDNKLPFNEGTFDIIINRHESFCLDEVYRILKPNGMFITQQVGGLNNRELAKFLLPGRTELVNDDNTLKDLAAAALKLGFEILGKDEYFPRLKFYDIGALVYFAKIIEWEFPGFTVDRCFEQLLKLHQEIKDKGYIESKEHRFLLILRKP